MKLWSATFQAAASLLSASAVFFLTEAPSARAGVVAEPGYSVTLLNDELAGPGEVEIDGAGNIFVANEGAPDGIPSFLDFVSKLDSNGATVQREFIAQLEGSSGLAIDAGGVNVYVSQDMAIAIKKYGGTGALTLAFTSHRPDFSDPNSLTLTQDGRLLAPVESVASPGQWRVLAFNASNGDRLTDFTPPFAFGFVNSIFYTNGRVLIGGAKGSGTASVMVADEGQAPAAHVYNDRLPTNSVVNGLTLGPDGTLYATVGTDLYKISSGGSMSVMATGFECARGMVVTAEGVLVSDYRNGSAGSLYRVSASSGGTISGTVHSEMGGEVTGGTVQVLFPYDWQVQGQAPIQSDGSYVITGLSSGNYMVRAIPPSGWAPRFYGDTFDINQAWFLWVGDSDTASGIDITVPAGGTISGRVLETNGVTPIADQNVWLESDDVDGQFGTRSGVDGRYTIDAPLGEFRVRAGSDGQYAPRFYVDALLSGQATPVSVSAAGAEVGGIDIRLSKGVPVSGRVTGKGNPLNNARAEFWIVVNQPDGGEEYEYYDDCNTDAGGRYTNYMPKVSNVVMRFQGPWDGTNWVTLWYGSSDAGHLGATRLDLTSVSSVSNVNIDLPIGGMISGIVTNMAGDPMEAVTMEIFDSTGQDIHWPRTESDGTFGTRVLPVGTYYVRTADHNDVWPGVAHQWFDGAPSFSGGERPGAGATAVIVPEGGTRTGVNFGLGPEVYEVWGGNSPFQRDDPWARYYNNPAFQGYVKLGARAVNTTATFSGAYSNYVIRAQAGLQVDAVRGSTGAFIGIGDVDYGWVEDLGAMFGSPDHNRATVREFVVIHNPGGWTGLTVMGPDYTWPVASVSPASHNFGSLQLGGAVTQTFAVVNTGDAALHVTRVWLQGNTNQFAIVQDGVTGGELAPFGSATGWVKVAYRPVSLWGQSVALMLDSDDPASPKGTMLYGTGADASAAEGFYQEGLTALAQFNATHATNAFQTARTKFSSAVAASGSNHYSAIVYWSMAEVVNMFYHPDVQTLLTKFGVGQTGRDILDWTATSGSNSAPTRPWSGEIAGVVYDRVMDVAGRVQGPLAAIPSNWVACVNVTPVYLPIDAEVQVDLGDVRMLQAALQAAKTMASLAKGYNVNMDLALFDDPALMVPTLFSTYPGLATVANAAIVAQASNFLAGAIDAYLAGSELIRAELDYQGNDMVVFAPEELPTEANVRDLLVRVKASLSGPVEVDDMAEHELREAVHLGRLFVAPFVTRAHLPSFTADGHAAAGTFPDPTFNGVLPGMTQAKLTRVLNDQSMYTNIAPGAAGLVAPRGTVAGRRPEFSWIPVTGATSYRLWVGKGGTAVADVILGATNRWAPTADLATGAHQWCLESRNSHGSTWSPFADFSVLGTPPGVPTPVKPAGVISNSAQTFVWGAAANAAWYNVVVTKSGVAHLDQWVQATSYVPATPLSAGAYQWKVRGWNADGTGAWSSTLDFTLPLPGTPTPISPSGPITNSNLSFVWNGTSNVVWYNVLVLKDAAPYLDRWVTNTSTSYVPAGPLPYGAYRWKVRGWNPNGLGAWSAELVASNGQVVAVSPSGVYSNSRPTTFQWQASADAEWCRVFVTRDNVTFLDQWVKAPARTLAVTNSLPGGDYRWWVQIWKADGFGPWSEKQTFTVTVQKPATPVLIAPAGVITSQPVFRWRGDANASWYNLVLQKNGAGFLVTGIQTVTNYTATPLGYGAYQWWVRPWGPDGFGDMSAGTKFSYGTVTPQSPLGLQAAGSLWYRWVDAGLTSRYDIWVGRNGVQWWYTSSVPVTVSGGIASIEKAGHTWGSYEWYVRGRTPDLPWSSAGRFEVGKAVPLAPTGTWAVAAAPTQFRWNDASSTGATRYRFWVQKNGAAFQDVWIPVGSTTLNGAERTCAIPWALGVGLYQVWMQTDNSSGYAPWSDGLTFRVQ